MQISHQATVNSYSEKGEPTKKEKDIEATKHYWGTAFNGKLYIDENLIKVFEEYHNYVENLACSLGVFVSDRFLMTLKLRQLRQVQNKPLSERATRSRYHNYIYANLVYSGLL